MKENEMIHTGRVGPLGGKEGAGRLSPLTAAMDLLAEVFGIYG